MRLRRLVLLLMSVALILFAAPAAMAEDDLARVAITIDGNPLAADAFIINGRTVAPLRAIFEALGATVEWNGETRTVTGTKGTTIIKLTIDQTEAYVGGKTVTLAVPALIINARTFVPVRFIAEALGTDVQFDNATRTVVISTGLGCKLPGGQVHSGTIAAGGETWGLCGSPHIITGDFKVEGKDTPVLTIEAGALIQFEHSASLQVGRDEPGGLVVTGSTDRPVTFASAQQGAMPGSWNGIMFYDRTDKTHASIENARIENGGNDAGLHIYGQNNLAQVLLKNVEIKNSSYAGLWLEGEARLAEGSTGLKINGTKAANGEGGWAIIASPTGANKLPKGEFKDNAMNAVHLTNNGTIYIGTNTTWSNIGIPYVFTDNVLVGGTSSPTLTLEPGVITLWDGNTALQIGREGPGSLVADAKAKPEGGGDWTIGKTDLEAAVKLADGSIVTTGPICGLCGSNKAIVFGSLNTSPQRGAWGGVHFFHQAGAKSRLVGTVVAYGGEDSDFAGGVYSEAQSGSEVKFQLANSLITGSPRAGLMLWDASSLAAGSTGNIFTGNGVPVRVEPRNIGSLEAGNSFTGNDNDWISVWSNSTSNAVTKSATWRDHGVPYYFEVPAQIGSSSKPVITIEAGAKFIFANETGIEVGSEGMGTLTAVGTAAKPITFTSELTRPGAWNGIRFRSDAGNSNKLEYVSIEYAVTGVTLDVDLGAFIKNSTIKNSSETGIYRDFDISSGTDFLKGLGNKFQGNAMDENVNE